MDRTETYMRLNHLMGMIYSACRMPLWGYAETGELYYTSCPHEKEMDAYFRISGALDFFLSKERSRICPAFYTDALGFSIVCDYVPGGAGTAKLLVLMGPFFNSSNPLRDVKERLRQLDLSISTRHRMLLSLQEVPILTAEVLEQYLSMLHHCITGQMTRVNLHECECFPAEKESSEDFLEENAEDGFRLSRKIRADVEKVLQAVRNGDTHYFESLNREERQIVVMESAAAGEEAGRQEKNDAIVYLTLCIQAMEEAGVTQRKTLAMQRSFMERIERSRTQLQLIGVMRELVQRSAQTVHEVTCRGIQLSKAVQDSCDYVHRHIAEELALQDIAAHVGYTEYYLTKKFYRELGIRLKDYILREKLELAKVLLMTTEKSVTEIAAELSFSTRSYFTRSFTERFGASPVKYKAKYQK